MTAAASCKLSVLVPSHDRRALLERCIESLCAQTLDPGAFELVVALDGSTDGSAEAVERRETPFERRILSLEKGGKSLALNAAIEAARGSVCVFLDDDVIASPELLAAHLAAHREDERTLGIGALAQQPPRARDWYAHCFAKAWNDHYTRLAEREHPDWSASYGGNLSAPRQALVEVGGLAADLDVSEDTELGFRLERHGCAVRYLPHARAVHDDQKPRERLLIDARRQGSGYIELVRRHPAMQSKLLGWFGAAPPRELALRRLLIALRFPPRLLALPGRWIPGDRRKQAWYFLVWRLAFWSSVRRAMDRDRWLRLTRSVPVLMYHAFGEAGDDPEGPTGQSRFILSRRSFALQMRLLSALRYRVIPFEQLARALRGEGLPPRRAAVITIDDGYRDNREVAHPILRRHRFPATHFLISRRLGGVNDWDRPGPLSSRPVMTLAEALQLSADGAAIGAHTRNHPKLPSCSDTTVSEEVGGSRADLESDLGEEIATFAYPYGALDRRAIAAVADAGYVGACTTEERLARLDDDPLRIPRLEVRSGESVLRFLRKLLTGRA
jgi:glycosyltransferase involved in cell wall biosynthesis/peptidoglycan/xylan/chitin deacetylase (PgdA/CDA1 family)